ncbi:MAG TPA: LysE family transporter [Thermomicrobiales bacterium]|nr:LysE family transporter [Thermomicrobiales bacterium]
MTELAPLLVSAIGLGAAYAAVPGAVNAEALRRGMTGGFRPALLVQVGSLVGDALWAVVGLTGAAALADIDALAVALGLIGAGFLFALARSALATAISGRLPAAGDARSGGSFAVGLVFGLANPAGIAFWAGVGGGLLALNGGRAAIDQVAYFLAAFVVGAWLWGCGMAALVGWGRRYAGSRAFRWINALCGLALTYFGVRIAWATLQRALRWLPWLARAFA